jgi:hypothetical protein
VARDFEENLVTSADAAAFCEACGLTAPLRLSVTWSWKPSPPTSLTLDRPFFLAGQDPRCQVHLGGPGIRGLHLLGQVIAGQVFLVDLSGKASLRWGSEAGLAGWLGDEAPVVVGPYGLTRTDAAGAQARTGQPPLPSPLELRPADAQALPTVNLAMKDRSGETAIWTMSRMLSFIGKMGICKLRLRHHRVAHMHASLVRTPQGVWIVDLLSREGTHVNGALIAFARLQDKDILRIGPIEMRVQIEANRPAAPQALILPLEPLPLAPSVVANGLPGPGANLAGGRTTGVEASLVSVLLEQFRNLQQQMFDQYQQSLQFLAQMMVSSQQNNRADIQQEMAALRQLGEELRTIKAQMTASTALPEPPRVRLEAKPAPTAQPTKPAAGSVPPVANGAAPVNVPAENAEAHVWLSRRIVELQQEHQTRWTRLLKFVLGP